MSNLYGNGVVVRNSVIIAILIALFGNGFLMWRDQAVQATELRQVKLDTKSLSTDLESITAMLYDLKTQINQINNDVYLIKLSLSNRSELSSP